MADVIVVGIGTNGNGGVAARAAASLAQKMSSTLVLVFGYESSPLGPRGGPLEARVEAIGTDVTTTMRDQLRQEFPGLAIDIELVRDRPVESLVRVAADRGAQMIVVGHGGRGTLRAALLGSTAYELVHRAPVPVLVIPDQSTDEGG